MLVTRGCQIDNNYILPSFKGQSLDFSTKMDATTEVIFQKIKLDLHFVIWNNISKSETNLPNTFLCYCRQGLTATITNNRFFLKIIWLKKKKKKKSAIEQYQDNVTNMIQVKELKVVWDMFFSHHQKTWSRWASNGHLKEEGREKDLKYNIVPLKWKPTTERSGGSLSLAYVPTGIARTMFYKEVKWQ